MVPDALRRWLRPRARIIATALLAGFAVGVVATLLLSLVDEPRSARITVFAVGALLLGFGTLGWSGSAMAGRGIENMQRHLETNTDWTEPDSRRAMARVAAFGLGLMVGGSLFAGV